MSVKTLEFIKTAILKHGDKYDYSKVDYVRNLDKVIIICKIHGDFKQTPKDHKTGCGCPNCGGTKKMTVNDFINKANLVHGGLYDYSKAIYKNNRTKLTIICNDHGEFEQSPDNHLQMHGCPTCANNQLSNSNDFINTSVLIHNNKYDYSKVNYIDNLTNVIIICPDHGEFEQLPKVHKRGSSCPTCAGNKKLNNESFIDKANLIHNYRYDYSNVNYINTDTKVIIICKTHGKFKQLPKHHLNGSGCPYCGGTQQLTTEEFIIKATKLHGNKYDYSNVNYMNNRTKIDIICSKHGEFSQIPNSHLMGYNCPRCSFVCDTDGFIEKANLKHGGLYDYSNSNYIDYKTKINIICKKHGEFQQMPGYHLAGYGCIKCSNYGYSNMQIHWLDFISKLEHLYISHALNDGEISIPGTKYKADGYSMYTNTIYEFHGSYWHGCPKIYNPDDINVVCNKTFGELYEKTKKREQLIIDKGYNLVTMWESDWKRINNAIKILQRKFKSIIS